MIFSSKQDKSVSKLIQFLKLMFSFFGFQAVFVWKFNLHLGVTLNRLTRNYNLTTVLNIC